MKKQQASLALAILLSFALLMTGTASASTAEAQYFKDDPVIEFLPPEADALVFNPVDGEIGVKLNNVLQDTLQVNYAEDTWFGVVMAFTLNAPVSGDTTIRLTDLNGNVTEYTNALSFGTGEQKLEIYAKTENPATAGYQLEMFFDGELALSRAIGEAGDEDAAETEAGEVAAAGTTASGPSVFPLNYTAFDNGYSITGYSVNSSGNTEITFYGSGYNKLPLRNGQFCVPVWCDAVSGGRTYESVSASVSSDNVVIFFDASFVPDRIIIQNGETWAEIAVFDVADQPETTR